MNSRKYRDEKWLRIKYQGEMLDVVGIAKMCGVTVRAIRKWLTRFNIKRVGRRRILDQDGYISIGVDKNSYGRGRRLEHILIAEKALGRRLRKGEVVHHVNGIRTDNRNCNLLICSTSYHVKLHYKMAREYMKEKFGGSAVHDYDVHREWKQKRKTVEYTV